MELFMKLSTLLHTSLLAFLIYTNIQDAKCSDESLNKRHIVISDAEWLDAVHNGDIQTIATNINNKSGTVSYDGMTALMIAVQEGKLELIDVLKDHEGGIKGCSITTNGISYSTSALYIAASKCYCTELALSIIGTKRTDEETAINDEDYNIERQILHTLLNSKEGYNLGIIIDVLNANLEFKLKDSIQNRAQELMCWMQDAKNGLIIENDARIGTLAKSVNTKGLTALMIAAYNGRLETVIALAKHEGGMRDPEGYTALMYLSLSDAVAALLRDRGEHARNKLINAVNSLREKEEGQKNIDGATALNFAIQAKYMDIANLLITGEFKIASQNESNNCLPQLCNTDDGIQFLKRASFTDLMISVIRKDITDVQNYLETQCGKKNIVGKTALQIALELYSSHDNVEQSIFDCLLHSKHELQGLSRVCSKIRKESIRRKTILRPSQNTKQKYRKRKKIGIRELLLIDGAYKTLNTNYATQITNAASLFRMRDIIEFIDIIDLTIGNNKTFIQQTTTGTNCGNFERSLSLWRSYSKKRKQSWLQSMPIGISVFDAALFELKPLKDIAITHTIPILIKNVINDLVYSSRKYYLDTLSYYKIVADDIQDIASVYNKDTFFNAIKCLEIPEEEVNNIKENYDNSIQLYINQTNIFGRNVISHNYNISLIIKYGMCSEILKIYDIYPQIILDNLGAQFEIHDSILTVAQILMTATQNRRMAIGEHRNLVELQSLNKLEQIVQDYNSKDQITTAKMVTTK